MYAVIPQEKICYQVDVAVVTWQMREVTNVALFRRKKHDKKPEGL